MQMDRYEFYEELKLRKVIREGINKLVSEEYTNNKALLEEEEKLRKIVRQLILQEKSTPVPDVDTSPARTTGINVLEDLLKRIIPSLEQNYKKLTTSKEQRESFKAHILRAVEDILIPNQQTENAVQVNEEAAANLEISDDEFIDIEGDQRSAAEIEAEEEADNFSIEGADETGRNIAFETFKQVSDTIVDSFDVLSNSEDKELFFDYLLKNLELYFDKFEGDMETTPESPEILPDEEVLDLGAEEDLKDTEEDLFSN